MAEGPKPTYESARWDLALGMVLRCRTRTYTVWTGGYLTLYFFNIHVCFINKRIEGKICLTAWRKLN